MSCRFAFDFAFRFVCFEVLFGMPFSYPFKHRPKACWHNPLIPSHSCPKAPRAQLHTLGVGISSASCIVYLFIYNMYL